MARPKNPRRICCEPCCTCFKPEGTGREAGRVDLMPDELGALKLHDVDGLSQTESAKRMKVSQPTFARILSSAHKKMAGAIVNGREIKIKSN
jgi:predicted DNA-binding protein (UPF0251 family)